MINRQGVVRPNKYMPPFQKVKEVPEGHVHRTQLQHIYVLEPLLKIPGFPYCPAVPHSPQPKREASVTSTS